MIENIVFSGGGFKGWAYIGTIRALDELIDFKNIKSITGVSIGSVFGLFYTVRIPWDTILDFIMSLNFKELIDIDIDNILVNQSILNGANYLNIIKEIISVKIDPGITFKELYRHSGILFTVNALNVSTSNVEYFNHLLSPDVKVIDAIMASSSIPLIFPAYKINNSYYYDGGLCNNCPANYIDELSSIAFSLSIDTKSDNNNIFNLIQSLMHITNSAYTKNTHIIYKILDSRFKNEMININQSRDDIFNIYMVGYTNSKNVIYDNYIALPGTDNA
jgi:NTE family protein